MIGVWLQDGRVTVRDDLPLPEPAADEALVRVDLAGICGTDHELIAGYAGFRGIPGHEFVGTVRAGPEALCGRRVVGEINVACGVCDLCDAVGPGHCRRRTVIGIRGRDGAFAQMLVLPARNLHVVPAGVPEQVAVFAEPLAAALRVLEQLAQERGETLVVGAGRLGQLVARVLARDGRPVSAVGHHARKLEILARRGVRTLADTEVREAGFDIVVDCSGRPDGYAMARRAVRPRGTVVLKSTHAGAAPEVDLAGIVVDEIRVLGSRCGSIERAIRALAEDDLGVGELVDARYPLRRADEAFRHSAEPGSLKILLEP